MIQLGETSFALQEYLNHNLISYIVEISVCCEKFLFLLLTLIALSGSPPDAGYIINCH
jgi:hypothetical protein